MMRALRVAVAFACAIVVASVGAAGAAPADPWVGNWKSIDTDGSNQTLRITKRPDGSYDVILYDDRASACGGIAADGKGVGTVSGNTMTGTTTITCADGRVLGTYPFKGTYNPANDTFTDGLGVVWSRVKTPKPPKAKPLPLGRLVLASREAPGLKQRLGNVRQAREALARALRPRTLPRITSTSTQASHFAKGRADLWSITFVMKTPASARAAQRQLSRAVRGSPVRIGGGGSVGGKRTVVAVWGQGRVVAAIVLRPASGALRTRSAVVGYARVVEDRVAHALSRTALEYVLDGIGPTGRISRRTALDMFALAYGPLPGTSRPPGPRSRILDATIAARSILLYWNTLSPAQRSAAADRLGFTGVKRAGVRPLAAGSAVATGRAAANFGDPLFVPDPDLQKKAEQFVPIFEQKLGQPLGLTLVVGLTAEALKEAAADAAAVTEQGQAFTDNATHCRIRVGPAGQVVSGISAVYQSKLLAHEVFHCMEFRMAGLTRWAKRKTGLWLWEGAADWAAYSVTSTPWNLATSFKSYLTGCDRSLLARSYDASGFFGHHDDSLGSFWSRAKAVFKGEASGDLASFNAAGGDRDLFLDTWPSSVFVLPSFGFAWTMSSPVVPPAGSGCAPIPIEDNSAIGANPYTTVPYLLATAYTNRPLLHIQMFKGRARLSDGKFVDGMVDDGWFCFDHDCTCPPDTEGFPPPALQLNFPAILGVTGGSGLALGQVSFVSLDEYCKQKQPGIVPIPQDKGGGGGKSCTHHCGRSFGDPHLITFDGIAYDFMAAGEFTLVRSKRRDLEIQVRQQPYPGSRWVSITTAAAMRVTGNRVVVFKGSPLQVRVNGGPVLVTQKGIKLPRGGTVRNLPPEIKGLPRKLEVTWPDGSFAQIWTVGDSGLALLVQPAASRAGALTGMLGNADGKKDNDFVTGRGRKLARSAILPGTRGRAYRLLYRQYGNSWRITRGTSLFDYAPGQSPATFADLRFPAPVPTLTIAAGDRKRLARAQAVCRRMRIKDPAVEASCVVDVLLTGNFDFARSATRLDRSVRVAKSVPKPKPKPKPAPKPKPTIARATLLYKGTTYTYIARKGFTEDGCTRDDVGGIAFRITLGTQLPTDKAPYFEIALYTARKDGTYKSGNIIVDAGTALFNVFDFTVTLASKRTRGTFSGKAPDGNTVSGSFRC